ncbi:MAG: cobalamin-binding protein [Daejeonella sp.]|nr:cobalamin-binding protein [Daejeonella sp.]
MTDKRIISLSPAATEIICASGLEKLLVGRSQQCNYSDEIKKLPVCSSSEVDRNIIDELNPDILFIEQNHFDILKGIDAKVINLAFHTLDDVFENISKIAAAVDAYKKGEELSENLKERIDIIVHKLKFSEIKPKTTFITQLEPLVIGENLMSELILIAGGSTLAATNIASTGVDLEGFKLEDPQIIIIMPENYSIQRTLQNINLLLNIPGWSDLSAVKNNQVYIVNSENYAASKGIRSIDSLEILAEIIHPKQFVFGYEGNGWIKFNS